MPSPLGGRSMKLRAVDKADLPTLASWTRELQEDEGASVMGTADIESRLSRWLSASYEAVIFEEEKPVGYALCCPSDPDLQGVGGIYLRQFFIVRHARRSGLGSAAFGLFLREVVNERRLVLEALTSNPTGLAFWRSLGLEEYATTFQIPGRSAV